MEGIGQLVIVGFVRRTRGTGRALLRGKSDADGLWPAIVC